MALAPVLFHGAGVREEYPEFSNFFRHHHPFAFVIPECCRHNDIPQTVVMVHTGEACIMYCKASIFGDRGIWDQIAQTSAPDKIKKLGRYVKNFKEEVWVKVRQHVARAVIATKFKEPVMLAKLMSTGQALIAEASPSDKIWGVGLGMKDTRAKDPKEWNGLNLLGESLMWFRNLKSEEISAEPPNKKPRTTEITKTPFGFLIRGADIALEKAQDYAEGVSASNSLVEKGYLRQVFGGRTTKDEAPPAVLQELKLAIVHWLKKQELKHHLRCTFGEMLEQCDNTTVNKYLPMGALPFHKDPPDYESFICCCCLSGPRTMRFRSGPNTPDSASELGVGDIYVVDENGYKLEHGSKPGDNAVGNVSVTWRMHKQ